jgi:hypothetical protein
MSLKATLEIAKNIFRSEKIPFALIGGFALGAYGIAKATADVDFMADGSRHEDIVKKFKEKGFSLSFDSTEILQFCGPGHVDVLLANRPLSKAMIQNAKIDKELQVPVADAEDIIALKIQAYTNEYSRELRDKADIVDIIRIKKDLDWQRVKNYAKLFQKEEELEDLKRRALS